VLADGARRGGIGVRRVHGRAWLAKSTAGDESASDLQALIAAAHRLDNLIHHRRAVLAAKAFATGQADITNI
jgi:hypothetical protein